MRSVAMSVRRRKPPADAVDAPGEVEAPDDTAWLGTEPLALKGTVELLEGIDGRPLLFDSSSGRYVAVSKAGTVVLSLLDDAPTADDVIRRVIASSSGDPQRIEAAVTRFFHELRQAGVLTMAPQDESRRQRLMSWSLRERMPRLPLTRSVHVLLDPVARLLRVFPSSAVVASWLVLVAAALSTAGYAVAAEGLPSYTSWSWLAIPLLMLQIAVHELGHALVCQYLRVPVREAGITLMLYVMPVAYVDRTDAYRVRSRAPRVLIALAGPMSDAVWAGVAGLLLLTADGPVHDVAGALLQLQLLLMLVNLNPLLPSDGYHALESTMGSVNVRGRSFAYLAHLVTRTPLPSNLAATGRAKRFGYLAFGTLCLAYGVVLVGFVLRSWWGVIEAVIA
ncbi:PqqD family peptide modification chaperone [Streptomyces sp. ISL-43]|uniref:PqqD family peptide modification chaperone n=1 Tax=Streptomyces sp. ISL-43 TaxID=2819183 RepID=UPI001BE77A48|nr:PqqD family peptide modification chaperone [Streptomyces sp. ISL-43]MBT2445592.1 PqqD family peptide modification chaperone [Streptomyces sp. ISL-43]